MKIKYRRKKLIEKLFNDFAFRMMFDDPKIKNIKSVYISRKNFKNNGKHNNIEIYFNNRKPIKILLKNGISLIKGVVDYE